MRTVLLLLMLTRLVAAQNWSGILPTSRAVDWTHAGVMIRSSTQTGCAWVGQYPDCVSGLPTNRTQCGPTVTPSGLQDYTDTWAINQALQNCATSPNTYVQLAAGLFYIVGGVGFGAPNNPYTFKTNVNNVTLRGMGPDQTTLRSLTLGNSECGPTGNILCIAGNGEQMNPASQYTPYGSTTGGPCAWTAGYAKGTTVLTLANCLTSTSNPTGMPQVGWHILLDQRNDDIGLTGCTSSGTTATCTVSTPTLPTTFVVGGCVGVGAVGNNAGMPSAGNYNYNAQPYTPQASGAQVCNPITAVTTNTFSYTLGAGGSNLAAVGPCNTYSSSTPGTVTHQTTSCGWASVDTGGQIVTGVPCVTMAGNCSWGNLSGGLTIGRSCPDIAWNVTNFPTCAAGEISVRTMFQIVTVTAVSGNQITIDTPLYGNTWRASQAPGVWWFTNANWQHDDGVEEMTIDGRLDGGTTTNSNFIIGMCYNCWIKNVRSLGGSRNHIWLTSGDAHMTIRDSYFYGSKRGASQSYAIETYGQTADLLFENNLFVNVPNSYLNGGTTGSVESYGYMEDDGYGNPGWMLGSISINHDVNGSNLFEANNSPASGTDDIHGTIGGVQTVFRQRERGQNIPHKNNALSPYVLGARNRGMNFVGGVYGTTGAQSTYQVASTATTPGPQANQYNRRLWNIGSTTQGATSISDDILVLPSIMRWGNYDVVTGAARWCGTGSEANCGGTSEMASNLTNLPGSTAPSSQTLPASFYLNSRPAWFVTPWGTPPWPPIGPDVTGGTAPDTEGGHSYATPAQLVKENAPIDTAYIDSGEAKNITSASWSGGAVTLTGTFALPVYATFQLSGINPAAYNGIFQISGTNGPANDNSLTMSSVAASPGITLPAGTPPGGSYWLLVSTTRVNQNGETTKSGTVRQTVPGTCPSSGNCGVSVNGPCNSAVVAGTPSSCPQSGSGLGGAYVATGYNVYAGWQMFGPGIAGRSNALLCKQNSTPIAITPGTATPAYVIGTASTPLVTSPCVTPPTTNTATGSQIQYLLLAIDGTNSPSPGSYVSGGTITYPLVQVFNADSYYGTGTITPPTTAPSIINGQGKITGLGKIT